MLHGPQPVFVMFAKALLATELPVPSLTETLHLYCSPNMVWGMIGVHVKFSQLTPVVHDVLYHDVPVVVNGAT